MKIRSRRGFIKDGIQAGFFLALANPFKAVSFSGKNKNTFPSWTELVDYARWCPTVHNLQPHKLKIISATEAELYYDPARLLPVGDPAAIFVTIALGVFVEHLSIAAAPYAAKVEITELYEPVSTASKGLTLFARLNISAAVEKEVFDRTLMLTRRTSRIHYNGKPLGQDTVEKLTVQTKKFNHEFFCSADSKIVDFVIKLNQQTLFEDLESEPDRNELNHLFRYTKKEAQAAKDGLWAKCMGFSGSLLRSVFQHHERWDKGLRKKLLADFYRASFKKTASVCWFAGSFDTVTDWLNAGKILARNWLLITGEGAYIHPFGSLITNKNAYQKINEKLAGHAADKKIWMICRAGYSDIPARSFRLNTEEILIT